MITEAKWLTPAQAAAHVSLSKQRLARLRLSGTGPEYHKIGRSILYDLAALDDWMARHRRRSTSDTGKLDHARSTDPRQRSLPGL
jgi:hypothetical protein